MAKLGCGLMSGSYSVDTSIKNTQDDSANQVIRFGRCFVENYDSDKMDEMILVLYKCLCFKTLLD